MNGGRNHTSAQVSNSEHSVSSEAARHLLLGAQGLSKSTDHPCNSTSLYRLISDLGFVQLDSISVVERAHHHILSTRMRDYRPTVLDKLQRNGRIFEHFTHDASLIPTEWFPHWRHRFNRTLQSSWLKGRLGGKPDRLLNAVRSRIEKEGPLMARHFRDPSSQSGAWWDWTPTKAALEFLWRSGELAIARRVHFEKVYDLTERVLPNFHSADKPEYSDHVEWACRTAIDRLIIATAPEIRGFWRALSLSDVSHWIAKNIASGNLIKVKVESADGTPPRNAFALADYQRRLNRCQPLHDHARLLSPFDPILRDRARCKRLFNFDYRFEAFVPEPKRKYGYYVLPLLVGDRIIARIDPKLDRQSGVLTVKGVWWESGRRPRPQDKQALDIALTQYGKFTGAKDIHFT